MGKEDFRRIEAHYKGYERELLKSGTLPMRSTSKGFWSGSICGEVFGAFSRLGLSRYKKFIDLGSGDGRVVLIASLFTSAEGIEIDPDLHRIALDSNQKLGMNAIFHQKDIFSHDLTSYDLLFINPDTPMDRGLEKKLLSEMKGALIVYGPHFHPRFLNKKDSFEVDGTMFTLYGKP